MKADVDMWRLHLDLMVTDDESGAFETARLRKKLFTRRNTTAAWSSGTPMYLNRTTRV